MQFKYRFFYGGNWNPFAKEAEDSYRRLSEERKLADPNNEQPTEKLFPKLDSWPQYVISESCSTFWLMERAIGICSDMRDREIEDIWKDASSSGKVDKWLKSVEADEIEKAMCYYIKTLHEAYAPNDKTVDFKLYFSEGSKAKRMNVEEGFSLTPYEGF